MPFTADMYHERKAILIAELGGVCVDCNAEQGLEFDHVDTDTKIACVTELLSNMEAARREAVKCVLRCSVCHTKKDRLKDIPPHGTVKRYNHKSHKCRCSTCRLAWSAYIKEYRKNMPG